MKEKMSISTENFTSSRKKELVEIARSINETESYNSDLYKEE